ncbi:MAG: hypothetical protein AAB288_12715 [Acidobacteriota bacterium]
MKLFMMTAVLCATAFFTFGQSAVPTPEPETKTVQPDAEKRTVSESSDADRTVADDEKKKIEDKKPAVGLTPTGYIRPSGKRRFKSYVNSVVGPFALTRYTITAGVLTWRNSPDEWGDKWEGFGRRFANGLGKSAVRNTTMYGLDEALKVDSTFYRSRDRSVKARLRNSVFSAVTARDRKGKRVIGIPRIAGGFASEIASSTLWYPARYDYVHGLKGGAISIGVNVGFNLLREFVWK